MNESSLLPRQLLVSARLIFDTSAATLTLHLQGYTRLRSMEAVVLALPSHRRTGRSSTSNHSRLLTVESRQCRVHWWLLSSCRACVSPFRATSCSRNECYNVSSQFVMAMNLFSCVQLRWRCNCFCSSLFGNLCHATVLLFLFCDSSYIRTASEMDVQIT
jgi:hypothetical protein